MTTTVETTPESESQTTADGQKQRQGLDERSPTAASQSETSTPFSLRLNEDQLQIQAWVHDFAERVIRPAAHEWDEREETPWPIIEEAAPYGLVLARLCRQCLQRSFRSPHAGRHGGSRLG